MFPLTASAAAYSFAVGTSESAVLQALRPPASTAFISFANFYRYFIRYFAKIAKLLYELTGEGRPFL